MIQPDMTSIKALSERYDIVPVQEEIYADVTTPILLLRRIARSRKKYFLLESIEGGEKWGRYSFLGYDPLMRVTCREDVVTIREGNQERVIRGEDPF